MARVGANYSLSPQMKVIASLIYANKDYILDFPDRSLETITDGYLAETQLIYRTDRMNGVIGGGGNWSDLTDSEQRDVGTATQSIGYGYVNLKIPENLIWTLGLSYESDETSSVDFQKFNPKLGMQWNINDHATLRAAAFQAVKRDFPIEQTIEPTQIAGFNQLLDGSAGMVSKNYGVGLDLRFTGQLRGGLTAIRRDLEVPFGTLDLPEFYEVEQDREHYYGAYLYWMPNRRWAVSASGLYQTFEVEEGLLGQLFVPNPHYLRTISFPLDVQYFDPSGFFSGIGLVYVNQRIQYLDPQSFTPSPMPMESDDFTLVNANLGYRLPKRWGIIALQVNNLFDRDFRYQDYSFRVGDPGVNPLYTPERTLFGRLVLNF
jgi:outer membrane receptor protein involved in Fe transport